MPNLFIAGASRRRRPRRAQSAGAGGSGAGGAISEGSTDRGGESEQPRPVGEAASSEGEPSYDPRGREHGRDEGSLPQDLYYKGRR